MHALRPLALALCAAALLGCSTRPPIGAAGPLPPSSLTSRALALFAEQEPSFDAGRTLARLASLAEEAGHRLAGLSDAGDRVRALNHFFFEELGFAADVDLEDPDNLFPDQVLRRRRGYCTGLALVYATVAEQLDLPVHAVNAPDHLFLRYDDGATRINIETLAGGRDITDEQYRRREHIDDISMERGVFLTNLDDDRFLSQLTNNLGTLHTRGGRSRRAEQLYQRAIRLDPLNPTAYYNLARQRMAEGRLDEAIAGFGRALELHPNDLRSLNNRGVCRAQQGDRDGAVADFLAVLAIDPSSESARRNLEKVAGSGS